MIKEGEFKFADLISTIAVNKNIFTELKKLKMKCHPGIRARQMNI